MVSSSSPRGKLLASVSSGIRAMWEKRLGVNLINVRPSVCKKFFSDLNGIWCVVRGR